MDTKWWKLKCDLCIYFFGVIVRVRVVFRNTVTCDQALLPLPPSEKKNDRSERKEGLIQLTYSAIYVISRSRDLKWVNKARIYKGKSGVLRICDLLCSYNALVSGRIALHLVATVTEQIFVFVLWNFEL